jgi:S-(hydroxymethyl)glutathione dehydrogenase/alcohol dehydrogenase
MRAAVLNAPGTEIELIDDLILDEPGPHEVLVDTRAVGVCHSDLHFIDGLLATPTPVVLGHEVAGTVHSVGPYVEDFVPGDSVVGCLTPFCGSCEFCLSGRMALCRSSSLLRSAERPPRLRRGSGPLHQFVNLSGFAERLLVHEHALVRVPSEVPMAVAAVIGCSVITGVGAVIHTADVRPGQSVAVVGCGGVGLSVVQGAVLAGASRVVAVDRSRDALDIAGRLGATDLVQAGGRGTVHSVRELTEGGVDHAFEAVGAAAAVEAAWSLLRRGGTVTVVGLLPAGATVEIPAAGFVDEMRIQGSNMGSNRFRTDVPYYVEMYRQGRLHLDALIRRTYDFEHLGQALNDLRIGAPGRGVIVFDDPIAGADR